jgi:hypothetical protein
MEANLFFRRMGIPVKESLSRHQETGRADAALQGCVFKKTLLKRMKLRRTGQPFDRGDALPIYLDGEDQTTDDGRPV